MLQSLFQSPGFAIGFIFFVLVLAGYYLLNRERAHVARMRGPRRFQPNWKRSKAGTPRRRRRRPGKGFHPNWSRGEVSASDPEEPSSPESK